MPRHPQINGEVKSTNKIIIGTLNKRLKKAKGNGWTNVWSFYEPTELDMEFNRWYSIFTNIQFRSSQHNWDWSPNQKILISINQLELWIVKIQTQHHRFKKGTSSHTYSSLPMTNHPILHQRCLHPNIPNQELGTLKGVPKLKRNSRWKARTKLGRTIENNQIIGKKSLQIKSSNRMVSLNLNNS